MLPYPYLPHLQSHPHGAAAAARTTTTAAARPAPAHSPRSSLSSTSTHRGGSAGADSDDDEAEEDEHDDGLERRGRWWWWWRRWRWRASYSIDAADLCVRSDPPASRRSRRCRWSMWLLVTLTLAGLVMAWTVLLRAPMEQAAVLIRPHPYTAWNSGGDAGAHSSPPLSSLCSDADAPVLHVYWSGEAHFILVVAEVNTERTKQVPRLWPSAEEAARHLRLRRWTNASLALDLPAGANASASAFASPFPSPSSDLLELPAPALRWSWEMHPTRTQLLKAEFVMPDADTLRQACEAQRNMQPLKQCAPSALLSSPFKRCCPAEMESFDASAWQQRVSDCSAPFPRSMHGFYTLETVGLAENSPSVRYYRAPLVHGAPTDPLRWADPHVLPVWHADAVASADAAERASFSSPASSWPPLPGRTQCLASVFVADDTRTCPQAYRWSVNEEAGLLMLHARDGYGRMRTQGGDVIQARFVQQREATPPPPELLLADTTEASDAVVDAAGAGALSELGRLNAHGPSSLRRDNHGILQQSGRLFLPAVVDLSNGSYAVPLPTATAKQRALAYDIQKQLVFSQVCGVGVASSAHVNVSACTAVSLFDDSDWKRALAAGGDLIARSFASDTPDGQAPQYRLDILTYALSEVCADCSRFTTPFRPLQSNFRWWSSRTSTYLAPTPNQHNDGDTVTFSFFLRTGETQARAPPALAAPADSALQPAGVDVNTICSFTREDFVQSRSPSATAPAGSTEGEVDAVAAPAVASDSDVLAFYTALQRDDMLDAMPLYDQATWLPAPLRDYDGPVTRVLPLHFRPSASTAHPELSPLEQQLRRTRGWPSPFISALHSWSFLPVEGACPPGVCVDSGPSALPRSSSRTAPLPFPTPDSCALVRYHTEEIRSCFASIGLRRLGVLGDSVSAGWSTDTLGPMLSSLVQLRTVWEFVWKKRDTPVGRSMSNYVASWSDTESKYAEALQLFADSDLVLMNSGAHVTTLEFSWQNNYYGVKLRFLESFEADLTEFLTRLPLWARRKLVWRHTTHAAIYANQRNPRFPNPADNPLRVDMIEQVNRISSRVMRAFGVPVIDYGEMLRGMHAAYADAVHPHAVAQEALTHALLNMLCNENFKQQRRKP